MTSIGKPTFDLDAKLDSVQLTETEFLIQVTQLAELFGWEWMHVRPAMKQSGTWRTPMQGPLGKGWPDLVLVRNGAILFVELKAERGKLTADQQRVVDVLGSAATVHVWRPSDWPAIMETIRR